MAIFIPNLTIETINKCNDLRITDNSIFTDETPKSLYDKRTLVINYTDGTSEEYDFPIGGSNSDTITISNFSVNKDYYVTINITYDNTVPIDPEYIVSKNFNHISTCNALVGRSKLITLCDCSCDDKCTISKLTKLDTSIENSIYAATFQLAEISQAFLDQSLNIIKSLDSDCNCK